MRLSLLVLIGCVNAVPETETPASMVASQPASLPPLPPSCDEGLEEGDCAPDFELLNADGTPIRLSDRVGERLVVVGSSLW